MAAPATFCMLQPRASPLKPGLREHLPARAVQPIRAPNKTAVLQPAPASRTATMGRPPWWRYPWARSCGSLWSWKASRLM
jgi:hypothetical protein